MATTDPDEPINVLDPEHDPIAISVYAFEATGGFEMERGFDTILRHEHQAPVHVDVTDSIQIKMDVGLFNGKLGTFDPVTDTYAGLENDSISLDAEEFTAAVTSGTQVFSVGKYATLYSDFQTYVANYFGSAGGFSSLFAGASEFAIDRIDEETANVFDGDSFVALLTGSTQDASGRYISDLSGSITISNISTLLKYAVDGNVFGNRTPVNDETGVSNFGVGDGFQAGDLIWVPTGTKIVLKLAIDAEALNPINNFGPSSAFGGSTAGTQSDNFTSLNGLFTHGTEATTELITRTVTAPLLIKLVTL
jgi:hypothetical protein